MSDEYSLIRPVDTVLSGPAASVLAGKAMTDSENYIIVDMGGTSTDISVVSGGKPVRDENGIRIGGWQTSVRGIKVAPFNLGGDSAIRLKRNGEPALFPRRVKPMCAAASDWPEILPELERIVNKKHCNTFPLHEFFYLAQDPEDLSLFNEEERKLIEYVRSGPKSMESLDTACIDIYALNTERLESEGIIMRCGLTPTDFMHIKGDFLRYDTRASVLAARFMLLNMGKEDTEENVRKLADEAYELVQFRMYQDIIDLSLQQMYPLEFKDGPGSQMSLIISEAWQNRNTVSAGILGEKFFSGYTLIGIGAPTHLFLPEAAKALGADYLLAENAEVANAIGALYARVGSTARVNITERYSPEVGGFFYIVHDPEGSYRIEEKGEALRRARKAAEKAAEKEARARGATGHIVTDSHIEQMDTFDKWGVRAVLARVAVAEAHAL
jgi:N-methylhydantoinase A/oxoprolinase/acetone carboxylase beta subunit